ncbi:MAG: M14 family metallopeptidase, partial [bacterium]|nr:M14 family metallopeptidase [bacterium]
IDGKDAGMMLLRDMTVRGTKRSVLEAVQWLFVPILSVDAHERSSPYSRINQRGPEEMGWRTNARNLNLNRDYTKADTPEIQAMLGLLNTWEPDLYVDVHVTDGIDYQYDVTWGANGFSGYSPSIAKWLDSVLDPALRRDLEAMGHIPGPLVFAVNRRNLEEGIVRWTASPRFSNGYGDARHLATVLVENHSLKPYDQRVLGTYVFLESLFVTVGRHVDGLRQATREDRARRRVEVPLSWEPSQSEPPPFIDFLGIEQRLEPSEISGGQKVVWTGRPVAMKVPLVAFSRVATKVRRPTAYWVPAARTEIIERLALHGIEMERLSEPREIEVEMVRLEDVALGDEVYEGHMQVTATPVAQRRRETFPAGSVRVPTDQPLGDLAVLLLEPSSPDSFFQWGFFLEILQRAEYFEAYVMEPIAERMLAEDEELRSEFARRLEEDSEFAADPRARLEFFYRRTPYFDARWRLYPVGRE